MAQLTLTANGQDLTLTASGQAVTFSTSSGDDLTLTASGESLTLTASGDDLVLSVSVGGSLTLSTTPDTVLLFVAAGSGEANTASNVGGGDAGVFAEKVGVTLEMRTFSGTGGIGVTENGDIIEIDGSGITGVTDHGALTGLADDDHLQYLNRSGVRPMTGPLNLGSNLINAVTNPAADQDAATRDYHDRGYLAVNRRSYLESEFIDFGNFAEGVVAILAGAGAINGPALVDKTNHPGIWCLETGTTAAGRGFIISSSTRGYHVGGAGITRVGSIVQTGVFLSTALEEFVDRAGFFSITLPNTILEGIGFEYQFDQNGGRWQGITADGIGESTVDLGITIVPETWYNLELEVNAAGTSVEFFIDGVSRGTLSANIPSGTGFNLFYNFHIMKLVGLLSRSFYIDHYYIYQEVTR